MKYPNIKAAHLSHAQIAKAFGYANVKSFRTSSAHQRHMRGVESILQQSNFQKLLQRLENSIQINDRRAEATKIVIAAGSIVAGLHNRKKPVTEIVCDSLENLL